MRPQGLSTGVRAFPLLATPLGARAKTVHLLSLLYYSILTLNQKNVQLRIARFESFVALTIGVTNNAGV